MCWPKRKCWFGINTHIHVVIPPYNEHSKYPESPQCVFFCMCPAYRAGLWVGGCGYPPRTHNSFIRAIHSQLAVTWLTRASGHLSTRSNAAETQIMAFTCTSSCCTSRWHCTWRTLVIAIISLKNIETRDLETFQSVEEYRVSNLQYRVSSILKNCDFLSFFAEKVVF